MPIEYHPEADDEYSEALDYLAARSPDAADRFERAVDQLAVHIARRPGGYPRDDEPGVRSAAVPGFPYALKYREADGLVVVLAVAHARRRPGYWADRV